MKRLTNLLIAFACRDMRREAQNVKRNIPYAEPANERQMLDVYAPENAKNLPVIFWIHGGGWQGGDKASVHAKPKAFVDKGYVFVSTNYRLLPTSTWKPSSATSRSPFTGFTTTSPSTAAIPIASS